MHSNNPVAMAALQDFYQALAEKLAAQAQLPSGCTVVPSSKSTQVAIINMGFGECYIKLFLWRSRFDKVKQALKGTRARRSVVSAEILKNKGFATPNVLAHGACRAGSWLVTESVSGLGLGSYCDLFLRGELSPNRLKWKRQIIRFLGETIGMLHNSNIVHGDLRLNNILIDTEKREPFFYFIDNERNRHYSSTPPLTALANNLVQVRLIYPTIASKTDQLRFLQGYCQRFSSLTTDKQRNLIEHVEQKYSKRFTKLANKPVPAAPERLVSAATNVPE